MNTYDEILRRLNYIQSELGSIMADTVGSSAHMESAAGAKVASGVGKLIKSALSTTGKAGLVIGAGAAGYAGATALGANTLIDDEDKPAIIEALWNIIAHPIDSASGAIDYVTSPIKDLYESTAEWFSGNISEPLKEQYRASRDYFVKNVSDKTQDEIYGAYDRAASYMKSAGSGISSLFSWKSGSDGNDVKTMPQGNDVAEKLRKYAMYMTVFGIISVLISVPVLISMWGSLKSLISGMNISDLMSVCAKLLVLGTLAVPMLCGIGMLVFLRNVKNVERSSQLVMFFADLGFRACIFFDNIIHNVFSGGKKTDKDTKYIM